jgi:hypothetical protein
VIFLIGDTNAAYEKMFHDNEPILLFFRSSAKNRFENPDIFMLHHCTRGMRRGLCHLLT